MKKFLKKNISITLTILNLIPLTGLIIYLKTIDNSWFYRGIHLTTIENNPKMFIWCLIHLIIGLYLFLYPIKQK